MSLWLKKRKRGSLSFYVEMKIKKSQRLTHIAAILAEKPVNH
jgi:hypothetical protein